MEDILDRTMYKDIKNMNREQMESFLKRIYENGYRKAAEDYSGSSADLAHIRLELAEINGIGDKRLDAVMRVIEKNLS